jgi:hypothetical protein
VSANRQWRALATGGRLSWRPGARAGRNAGSPSAVARAGTVLEAGLAAPAWDEDQCWTLARITEVDPLPVPGGLHPDRDGLDAYRIGWSMRVPARCVAERDEALIAVWREEAWPLVNRTVRTWGPRSSSSCVVRRRDSSEGETFPALPCHSRRVELRAA